MVQDDNVVLLVMEFLLLETDGAYSIWVFRDAGRKMESGAHLENKHMRHEMAFRLVAKPVRWCIVTFQLFWNKHLRTFKHWFRSITSKAQQDLDIANKAFLRRMLANIASTLALLSIISLSYDVVAQTESIKVPGLGELNRCISICICI